MLPLLTDLSVADPSSQPRRRVAGVVLMGLLGGGQEGVGLWFPVHIINRIPLTNSHLLSLPSDCCIVIVAIHLSSFSLLYH